MVLGFIYIAWGSVERNAAWPASERNLSRALAQWLCLFMWLVCSNKIYFKPGPIYGNWLASCCGVMLCLIEQNQLVVMEYVFAAIYIGCKVVSVEFI